MKPCNALGNCACMQRLLEYFGELNFWHVCLNTNPGLPWSEETSKAHAARTFFVKRVLLRERLGKHAITRRSLEPMNNEHARNFRVKLIYQQWHHAYTQVDNGKSYEACVWFPHRMRTAVECAKCHTKLGWEYQKSSRERVGKFTALIQSRISKDPTALSDPHKPWERLNQRRERRSRRCVCMIRCCMSLWTVAWKCEILREKCSGGNRETQFSACLHRIIWKEI